MTLLSLSGVSVRRGRRVVVEDATLDVVPGEFVGLIGPNGAGKTTLLRAALGLLPCEGRSSLAALPPRARARTAAWLPQSREIAWALPVRDVVALGRLPHLGAGARLSAEDAAAVEAAMAAMDVERFADRPATALSGGEQARVLIARALAQGAPLLLADEPIAGLDPAHQIGSMRVFRRLADEGRCVVAALHDLTLAARHCTRLVMLDAGRIAADGPPEEVLAPATVARVFGVRAGFTDGPHPAFLVEDVLE